ncbi:MAG: hypothetical protein IT433_04070 [Phycisphaerales bacterium]|nr:hypothetical protein [Phycisphaerales bacterium]
MTLRTTAILTSLALPSTALAQPDVSAMHKFSWSENCGWMNWRDAGDGTQRATIEPGGRFLSGFVWMENVGWLNLGDGSPANGATYANTTGSDFGVNIDTATGQLSGLAWGENVGWVNFGGGTLATPPDPAMLDLGASRLFGYAWGENIGWINLDHAVHYVGFGCEPDLNQDGNADQDDLAYLVNVLGGGDNPTRIDPDFNLDGNADQDDIAALINVIAGGPCP